MSSPPRYLSEGLLSGDAGDLPAPFRAAFNAAVYLARCADTVLRMLKMPRTQNDGPESEATLAGIIAANLAMINAQRYNECQDAILAVTSQLNRSRRGRCQFDSIVQANAHLAARDFALSVASSASTALRIAGAINTPFQEADPQLTGEDILSALPVLRKLFANCSLSPLAEDIIAEAAIEASQAAALPGPQPILKGAPRPLKLAERTHLQELRKAGEALKGETLALRVRVSVQHTYNVMRHLVHDGFAISTEDGYALTPLGRAALKRSGKGT